MSFYSMMHGFNKFGVFFILPMLDKHPDEYPRFRDCFLSDEEHPEYNGNILVYTRVGGGNRGEGYGEEDIMSHPNFITTYDDNFDRTYGMYVFSVPEQWREDFELLKNGKLKDVSEKYQLQVRKIYPKLSEQFDNLWNARAEREIGGQE